jgi:5-methylcytosine-specific restriction endonuclease McrA
MAYHRYGTMSTKVVVDALINNTHTIQYGQHSISITSNRMRTYTKGISCVHCKKTITFFAVERNKTGGVVHLNPYHVNNNGNQILMTSDHIIPKSKGGSNDLVNRQVMCYQCNSIKGSFDTIQEALLAHQANNQYKNSIHYKVDKIRTMMANLSTIQDQILHNNDKNWTAILSSAQSAYDRAIIKLINALAS